MTSQVSAGLSEAASVEVSSSVARLQRALETEPQSSARFQVISVPVPALAPHSWLTLEGVAYQSCFADPSGYEHAALEELEVLREEGPERFRAIAAQAQALFAQIADPGENLRVFGGFAFQPGRARSELFRNFGEARFVLPRLTYERRDGHARLHVVVRASELGKAAEQAAERRRILDLVERALKSSETPAAPQRESGATSRSTLLVDSASEAEFMALVERSRQAILRGELEKVVLARRVDVRLTEGLRPERLLQQLSATAPECVRYAFGVQGQMFLGATPERLVKKQGASFDTEAVAGSVRVDELSALRLLESSKDRAEHAIVVREVLQSLRPLCATLEPAEIPEIHRLRHVAHLRTRIRGRLLRPEHILELVARLHPTPAVGGFPSARAQAWIAEHEPAERGWYSGPIGWFDRHGDGAFVVALRCGMFHGQTAALFAGAGIVEGSDPESELQETRWKLQALLGALGVRS